MSSYDQAMDVGKIILQALGDLKEIRKGMNAQAEAVAQQDESAALETQFQLDSVLSNAEFSLRDKAEKLSEVIMQHEKLDDQGSVSTSSSRRPLPGARKLQRDHVSQRMQKKFIPFNPATHAGRAQLAEKHGIPSPSKGDNARSCGKHGGAENKPQKPVSAITIKAGTIIPKHIREDPYADPPPLVPEDMKHGVLNLINRGLLPNHIDMTSTLAYGGAPLAAGGAELHSPREAHDRGDIATTDLIGYNVNNLRLDLLTRTNTDAFATTEQIVGADFFEDAMDAPKSPPKAGKPPRAPLLKPKLFKPDGTVIYQKEPAEEEKGAARMPESTEADKPQQRQYEELLDNFSLHEILIRRGATLDSTPEFSSFKRAYVELWVGITDLLLDIETICRKYAIPLAVIDGKALADLAREHPQGAPAPANKLLSCVKNIEAVSNLIQQPGRRYLGPDGKAQAAITIQRHARGHVTRQNKKYAVLAATAVIPIQRWFRVYLEKKARIQTVNGKQLERDFAFAQRQERFAEEWDEIQESERVLIHLPSISAATDLRLNTSHFQVRQNSQMSRLCDLADPNVDIVYVSPYPLPDDISGYYDKLLQVGGWMSRRGDTGWWCRRITTGCQGTCAHHHAVLLPYALNRIKAIIRGRKAYLVPGAVSHEEILLADRPGVPILASHPENAARLANKSAARQVFKEAEVNVPPGAEVPIGGRLMSNNPLYMHVERIRDEDTPEDLIATLASLVVEFPATPRWILKIDDESNGRGHAWIDITAVRSLDVVLERLRQSGRSPPPLARQREAVAAVEAALRRTLPRRLGIAAVAVYPTWKEYAQAMLSRGGVIEGCPPMVTGSPSVNLMVEPTGRVQILSTHEQIFCPAYRFIGASFPQSSVPHAALAQASEVVGQACFRAGIVGNLGVDFVALKELGTLRLWAVDLNLRTCATQSTFALFDFICKGQFDPKTGAYMVRDYIEEDEKPDKSVDGEADDTEEILKIISSSQRDQEKEPYTPGAAGWQRRFYVMNDFISHSNLASIQYAAFFNRCRLDGVCFDMQERVGTAFSLVDSFASGVMGVICVGHSPQEAFRELANALDFIARQVGPSEGDDSPDALEENNFRCIHSTIKYLADKLSVHVPR
ncbi:hypothetical protein CYMTET_41786 [Cymbomonas tetramitiformis]|uniref:IQCH-like ATP-grasp domain-containing protein n=1 Tax=Cymbomonas tetramitiformis TaxID=36881 RepID=A0AAE0C6G2_9CHLO|nr:hypothetical protein CYMTET_41786 [Cymbomonas tetramitiformis]